ncbi:hypothetical protein LJM37_005272, partial [Serratia marcescens]
NSLYLQRSKLPRGDSGGFFLQLKLRKMNSMKINKTEQVTVRLTPLQVEELDRLISTGIVKTRAAAVQYIINQYIILGGGKK